MSQSNVLECALTYRDATTRRETGVPTQFQSTDDAIAEWFRVLMHEASEAMATPLDSTPECAYLHPVDVDTADPGVVTDDLNNVTRTSAHAVNRVTYARATAPRTLPRQGAVAPPAMMVAALDDDLRAAEKWAAATEKRQARSAVAKAQRAAETEEDRATRLERAREQRATRKARAASAAQTAPSVSREQSQNDVRNADDVPSGHEAANEPSAPADAKSEDVANDHVDADVSVRALVTRGRKRAVRGKVFASPAPHHRHLSALQWCEPHPDLHPALLHGAACAGVQIIDGPPGTGKTRELVRRAAACVASGQRVLLCAPTNVGAANLYARCASESALKNVTTLCLPPDRVPPGTRVTHVDVADAVCATVSGRSGRTLVGESFDAVFVDEAAQCMEAWTWTLLRPDVRALTLAGDARQLRAVCSRSGATLGHDRSMLERLLDALQYKETTALTVQHRMAPEILAVTNARFYAGALTCGAHAPSCGHVVRVELAEDDVREEAVGTSFANAREVEACAAEVRKVMAACDRDSDNEDVTTTRCPRVVLLTPYAAQARRLLAQRTGVEVHTIDSFQGREADTVVLSAVRDGSAGVGFWNDARRVVVALTRARTRLVIVRSHAARWPEVGI